VLEHGGLPYYALNQHYLRALREAGADTVLLPAGSRPPAEIVESLTAVLLPGGLDVHPRLYGEEPSPHLGRVDQDLDALEMELVHEARRRRLPLMGICRGHQAVNVALGGSLYQDIKSDGLTDAVHWTPLEWGRDHLAHPIDVDPGSTLYEVVGPRVDVNSFHHQAVKAVAPGLRVTALSPDSVIEAMESADGLIITVQCHPESLTAHRWARDLFTRFLGLARVPA
jgi:putative glutamine amidotransferase